jgi:rhodanese-related sulfurtransferase
VSLSRTLDPNITMAELLTEYPGAQRALFRAYHIGGCASCGFQPEETLAELCRRNDNLPVDEVLDTISKAQEADERMQVAPEEVARRRQTDTEIRLVDVRSREEWEAVHIPGSTFLTQELLQEIVTTWPKDQELVFVCHHGVRSLDAAAYFLGHGFVNARSLSGGIEQWSQRVDPSLPRYDVE